MVEVPKMLSIKHNLKFASKFAAIVIFTLLSGTKISCLELSKPATSTASWIATISSLWAPRTPSPAITPKPVKSESELLAEQLQTAIAGLRFLYQNTPEELDLNQAERTVKLTELADQIDQLISNQALNLQDQPKEFYWSFSFPTQELLELNKIETLKKYLLRAKITDQLSKLLGVEFTANFAFIGILNKKQFTDLIETNKAQIAISKTKFEINSRCCLWRYLIDYKHNPFAKSATTVTAEELFLTETLKSNIFNAIKFAVDRSNHNHLAEIRSTALSLNCSPVAITYIDELIHLSNQKKLQAHDQAVQSIFNHIMQVLKCRQKGPKPVYGNAALMSRALDVLRVEGYSFKDDIVAEVIIMLREEFTAISCSPSYQSKFSGGSVSMSPVVDHPLGDTPTSLLGSPSTDSVHSPDDRSRATSIDSASSAALTDDSVASPASPITTVTVDMTTTPTLNSVAEDSGMATTPKPAKIATSTSPRKYIPAYVYIIRGRKITGGGTLVTTDTKTQKS